MSIHAHIFKNNYRWAAEKKAADLHFFEKLAKEQNPEYLYIGCSDSRVVPNIIMGLEPGEVFVHRNVGNLVSDSDLSSAAVIEYALFHLKVQHVIVCGHYDCGAIKGALENKDFGVLNPWLQNIRNVHHLRKKEFKEFQIQEQHQNRLTELNVLQQCHNVVKTETFWRAYAQNKSPMVHGWVFDLGEGILKDLEFNLEKAIQETQDDVYI